MTPAAFMAAADATWPAAAKASLGPWTIREGQGGGKRVSAATAEAAVTDADITTAEAAMTALDQEPLFMIRNGDEGLDTLLEARGYGIIDPVVIMAAPVAAIATEQPPPISAFAVWPPLKIMEDLWAEGGIGPARLAVMQRACDPKTSVLGRSRDRAAGTAFLAVHEKIAVCHALEITPDQRRQGTAVNMMRKAAFWAQDQGAESLAVLVTQANAPARALYASLGMQVVGIYYYRMNRAQRGQSS